MLLSGLDREMGILKASIGHYESGIYRMEGLRGVVDDSRYKPMESMVPLLEQSGLIEAWNQMKEQLR